MSVLDIKLTLTLDVELTLKFGHPMLQPTFNQASLTLSAYWDCWFLDIVFVLVKNSLLQLNWDFNFRVT